MENLWQVGRLIKENIFLTILINSLMVVFLYYTTKGSSFFVRWLENRFFLAYWANTEIKSVSQGIIERYGYVGLAVISLIPFPFFREAALLIGVVCGLRYTLPVVVLTNAFLVYISILAVF